MSAGKPIDHGIDELSATDPGGAEVFRRILVAMDGSAAARSAFVFVTNWVRQFDTEVWFIVLTDENSRRGSELVTDVPDRGRQLSNTFTVSGATRGARNVQLASGIAEAAKAYRADLIVVGFDPGRMAGQRFTKGVRELLTAATRLPVLEIPQTPAPKTQAARCGAQSRLAEPIALGPAELPARDRVLVGA